MDIRIHELYFLKAYGFMNFLQVFLKNCYTIVIIVIELRCNV